MGGQLGRARARARAVATHDIPGLLGYLIIIMILLLTIIMYIHNVVKMCCT